MATNRPIVRSRRLDPEPMVRGDGSSRAALHAPHCMPLEPRTVMSAVMPLDTPGGAPGIAGPVAPPAPIIEASRSLVTASGSASGSMGDWGSLLRLDALRGDARFSGVSGSGLSTVIIDTGIDRDHVFFGGDADGNGVSDRIVYQWDFADNDADASDRHGHGSNVASITGASDATYGGVAPGVSIIALKVFGDSGGSSFSTIERALQWVVSNVSKYNISSVNLSVGDGKNYASTQRLYGISDEIEKLSKASVKVVAAAGNSYYQFNSPGVSYPAADPNVIGVGAVFSVTGGDWSSPSGAQAWGIGADEVTPFTQRHPSLTPIFAPGAPMVGAGASGGLVAMAGTSQAAPVVAGAAALADQIAMQYLGRKLTPAEFKKVITQGGVNIKDGDNENDNVKNTGASYKRLDFKGMADGIVAMAPKKTVAASTAPKATTPAQTPAKTPASTPTAPTSKTTVAAKTPATDPKKAQPVSRIAARRASVASETPVAMSARPDVSEAAASRRLGARLDLAGSVAQSRMTGAMHLTAQTRWTFAGLSSVRVG